MKCNDKDSQEWDDSEPQTKGMTALSRRELLVTCCQRTIVLLPVLAVATETVNAQSTVPKGWVLAGKTDRFREGTPVSVTLPDKRQIFLRRIKGGRFLALSARCPHAGCAVAWRTAAKRFVCPCHGATFREDGTDPTGPARSPLTPLTVRVQGGNVWVAPGTLPPVGRSRGHSEEDGEQERHEERSGHEDED